jgi:rhodanese-related sulfurtransferase
MESVLQFGGVKTFTLVDTTTASSPILKSFAYPRTGERNSACKVGVVSAAVNIPVDDLRSRLGELPHDQEIAVYCQVGQRGYLATRILRKAGLPAANMGGGYKTYQLFHPEANGR